MIQARIYRNRSKHIVGFTVKNHGESHVCAAVSVLVLNTVNSIEALTGLTEEDFQCSFSENGGFITFSLNDKNNRDVGAGLLLDAMVLGLECVCEQHPDEIKISLAASGLCPR